MSETKAPATLGPNQIKWCRTHIPAFDLAWRSTQAAEAQKAKIYERMGVEPGSVGVPSERTGEAGLQADPAAVRLQARQPVRTL